MIKCYATGHEISNVIMHAFAEGWGGEIVSPIRLQDGPKLSLRNPRFGVYWKSWSKFSDGLIRQPICEYRYVLQQNFIYMCIDILFVYLKPFACKVNAIFFESHFVALWEFRSIRNLTRGFIFNCHWLYLRYLLFTVLRVLTVWHSVVFFSKIYFIFCDKTDSFMTKNNMKSIKMGAKCA